ncbi:MAG: acyltransferase [Halobacteriales archaeon]|nr:acyltransferase [Halobacteriales archaeon]
MTKRHLDLPEAAQETIDTAIGTVDSRLASTEPTPIVVRDLLADLYGDRMLLERYLAGEALPPMATARLQSYDPRNAYIESERWAEQDLDSLRESKSLQYLWRGFDQSPLSNNIAVALPFRQTLANHLFAEAGDGLRLFGGIKIQCGHNITMGDNTVVHNDVLLDDRGELVIGDRVSIADNSHIHTHGHDVVDQTDVTTYRTVLEDDVRLGYGAMVSAGCRVGTNAMVGTSAMVRGDVPAHHIAVGTPAKSVRVKPGFESRAEDPGPLADNREARTLERPLPDGLDPFDEFGREPVASLSLQP